MKSKKQFFKAVLAVALGLVVLGAEAQQKAKRPRPRRIGKPSGGLVITKAEGKHVVLLNAQKVVPREALEQAAQRVLFDLLCPYEVVDAFGAGTLDEKVAAAKSNPRCGVVIPFVEGEGEDLITYYSSRGLCVVNMKVLSSDNAAPEKLAERTGKAVWKAYGVALGAGESPSGVSVLRRAANLRQLDANSMLSPTPEQHNQMVSALPAFGIRMVRIGTYRTACTAGWAPAPTNDVQKAIWDEVHALPTNPITIKPETKKVTE